MKLGINKVYLMGDFVSLIFGIVIFIALIVYVPACEKV